MNNSENRQREIPRKELIQIKKKLLIIVFMLAVLLSACGERGNKDVANSKYIGTWKCESMTIGSEKSAPENEIILTLNGDGTAVLASGDDVTNANWEELSDGFKLTDNSQTIQCKTKTLAFQIRKCFLFLGHLLQVALMIAG